MDVDDAETAQREGNYKKEFAVYKAHINDLYYNRAQVVTALNKEEVSSKKLVYKALSYMVSNGCIGHVMLHT